MAIKGVPIDLNKKYKMQDGTKITNLVLRDKSSAGVLSYPILGHYTNKRDSPDCLTYTFDGFFRNDKGDHPYNLMLDKETKMAETINDNTKLAVTKLILNCTLNSYLEGINKTPQKEVIENIMTCIEQVLRKINNGD